MRARSRPRPPKLAERRRKGPYTYDPYSNGAPATGFPFKYTGRRLDPETGLYYYRARYYSSALGRFLQTDPIGYQDQMNLYAYVGNDPINFSDPFGLEKYTVSFEISFVEVLGGKFGFSLSYDDETMEAGASATMGARVGGQAGFAIGIKKEDSSKASAKNSMRVEVSVVAEAHLGPLLREEVKGASIDSDGVGHLQKPPHFARNLIQSWETESEDAR